MLSLEETWIKAAVEHRIINIDYFSARTKREHTNRDIEPDFVGTSKDGKNSGLWAIFCHLRHQGPRCFIPNTLKKFIVTSKTFNPSPRGRWQELVPIYNARGLKVKEFGGE